MYVASSLLVALVEPYPWSLTVGNHQQISDIHNGQTGVWCWYATGSTLRNCTYVQKLIRMFNLISDTSRFANIFTVHNLTGFVCFFLVNQGSVLTTKWAATEKTTTVFLHAWAYEDCNCNSNISVFAFSLALMRNYFISDRWFRNDISKILINC